jgi:hypothetical protein
LLENITCPYCGIELNDDNSTKEHVIGRRFVPKGTLDGHWNLIVRACARCNSEKADLENDISAISLFKNIWPSSGDVEEHIITEAYRKSKNSISNKTCKPVIKSQEKLNIKSSIAPGATFQINMVAPPQVETKRLYRLAQLHMMAFFYHITYSEDTKRGGFLPEGFHPLSETHHADWGNSIHKSFMAAVVKWEPHLIANTANGFFRLIVRKHPDAEC